METNDTETSKGWEIYKAGIIIFIFIVDEEEGAINDNYDDDISKEVCTRYESFS